MFNDLIMNAMPSLVKFFELLRLKIYFTNPQLRHLKGFVVSMMLKGYSGKITDVAELALHAHRSCVSRFLDSDSWNCTYLLHAIRKYTIDTIWQAARRTRKPIYVIFDDTICEKAIPSSKVISPIYGCGFYRSHLKNKTVYGQQFVGCMLRVGDLVLPYDIVLYEKAVDDKTPARSKISIVEDLIKSLPSPPHGGFVVTDSWYSCKALFDASSKAGYHFIGGLKCNRLVFPRGYRKKGIKISKFAQSLKPSDFDFVTVGEHKYYVYTYLGKINGQRKVKIIITYPMGAFGNVRALKAFITTDIQMNPSQLIAHYMKRWPIEVFFRESNRYLGMKTAQVRSKKSVTRYQYVLMLAFAFCGMNVSGGKVVLGIQRRKHRQAIEKFKITWAYKHGQMNTAISDVLVAFKIA